MYCLFQKLASTTCAPGTEDYIQGTMALPKSSLNHCAHGSEADGEKAGRDYELTGARRCRRGGLSVRSGRIRGRRRIRLRGSRA